MSDQNRPVQARNVRVVPQTRDQQRSRVERLAEDARGRARKAGK